MHMSTLFWGNAALPAGDLQNCTLNFSSFDLTLMPAILVNNTKKILDIIITLCKMKNWSFHRSPLSL